MAVLAPPLRIDESRLLRTTVGLRPYRPDGFVVRNERLGEKIVVHDYGHGGSGMTLCWGTAQMAIESVLYNLGKDEAIIGGGVIGLADDGRMTKEISDRVVKAARIAYDEFDKLRTDQRYAIRKVPIYYIDDKGPSPGVEKDLLPDLFDGPVLPPG